MVVRGVVRRVVRGVGSVGSPRSGGQFFQLSQLMLCSDMRYFRCHVIKRRKSILRLEVVTCRF